MKKTYNLSYEKGQYYIEYSLPGNNEGKLIIDEKKMELDSVNLYKMFFENATESIEISICNKIGDGFDRKIKKKGERVAETIQTLCEDICKEIGFVK